MIVSRNAKDQWHAYDIASAMDAMGIEVISISSNGSQTNPGALMPATSFIVWGKYSNEINLDEMDALIDRISSAK